MVLSDAETRLKMASSNFAHIRSKNFSGIRTVRFSFLLRQKAIVLFYPDSQGIQSHQSKTYPGVFSKVMQKYDNQSDLWMDV